VREDEMLMQPGTGADWISMLPDVVVLSEAEEINVAEAVGMWYDADGPSRDCG
jgi:hypothetical protein